MNNLELRHQNLYFFDKNGEYYNFSYEGVVALTQKPFDWDHIYEDKEGHQYLGKETYYKEDPNNENNYIHCEPEDDWGEDKTGNEVFYYTKSDKWVGEIYLDEVSTDLFSTGCILILEKDKQGNYRLPWKKIENENCWIVGFQEELNDIFLFGYDENYINYTQSALSQEPNGPDIVRTNFLGIPLSDETSIQKEAAVINFALCSSEENTFKRTLYIYEADKNYNPIFDDIKETLIATITIYGKTIGEDERFKTICENFGYNIIDTDIIAFEKTNIKEILPDWTIINEKRKEIILEGHNIYPYIGAYKGIINAIKYFGYNELQLREFWKNVDPNSPYYGKYVQTDCIDFLSVDNVRFNQPKVTLPSKQYRKTSLFALVYKINDITPGVYDEDDLPLTHENQYYTQEEILIKLFALKRKLEKDFLPLNARIKDIIGEADFFTLNELTNSVGVNVKNNIQVGISPKFTVVNGEKYNELDETIYANLVDLRTFLVEYYNSTSNSTNDAPVTFYDASKKTSGLISWWNMFVSPREKYSLIIDDELVCLESVMTQGSGDDNFSVQKLRDTYLAYFKDYSPNLRHTGYWEEGKQPEYLGDIDPLPDNWHFITNFTLNDNKEYRPYNENDNIEKWIDPKTGIETDKFVNEDIVPIGALVLLKNTTFDNFIFDNEGNDETIDDMEITYDELAQGNKYDTLTFCLENFAEYGYDKNGNLLEAEDGDELILNFEDKIVITYTTKTNDTVNSIMKSIYVECIENKKEYPELFKNIEFYFNEETNELEAQGIDAYKLKWSINHPPMPSEFEESVESNMRYSVAVSNRKALGNPMFAWDNIHKFDTTGIEWTIKKEATEVSPSYYFNSFEEFNDRDIEKYNELPIVLPYIGKYTVEMRLYNMYNHISSLVKKDYIEVVGREVEFSGWYTSQEESNGFEQDENEAFEEMPEGSDSGQGYNFEDNSEQNEDLSTQLLEYWSSKAVTPRNNEYTWEKCKDFEIGEYGSPLENAIKPIVTWGEVTPALYEGLDNANIIENNTIDTYDRNSHTSNFQNNGLYSNKGAYIWKNCKCTWNEVFHKSWNTTEETGDIPFYIDIEKDVIGSTNGIQWTGVQNTEVGDYGLARLEWSNPKIRFELQKDFRVRNEIEEYHKFDYTLTPDMNLIDLYNALAEWLNNTYNIDIERYINVNYVYKEDEYFNEKEIIISDKKLYLEHSDKEEECAHYIVDGRQIRQNNSTEEDEYTIYYLKQIADVEFEQRIGMLSENDIINRTDGQIPVVNINRLVKINQRPCWRLNGELTEIQDGEMYDVPDELLTGNPENPVNTDFVEGLVAWKYYKHLTGKRADEYNEHPKIWYYTYVNYANIDFDSENGESTKHINRLIPTLEPVDGMTIEDYTPASNLRNAQYTYKDVMCSYIKEDFPENPERYKEINKQRFQTSFVYYEYPLINEYEYYKVVPCYHYKLVPYVKYSYKPDKNMPDPTRLQFVGKYSSQLCDIFNVDVVWDVIITSENTIAGETSFGLEGTGVFQHNTEIHNPTWNNVNFINSWKKLPKLTRICFTYDKCKILGKRNPTWTFKNITTGTEKVIKSKYGMYLFTEAGDYSITLELYDSNKNKYIATKNYLTII